MTCKGLQTCSSGLPGNKYVPHLLFCMSCTKKLKNLFWAFCQPQNCLQYCSALKMDIVPRSQHKQDTLSVPAVLGAVSAAGHEDVKGTGKKNLLGIPKLDCLLNIYVKKGCPRVGEGGKLMESSLSKASKLIPRCQAAPWHGPLQQDHVGRMRPLPCKAPSLHLVTSAGLKHLQGTRPLSQSSQGWSRSKDISEDMQQHLPHDPSPVTWLFPC